MSANVRAKVVTGEPAVPLKYLLSWIVLLVLTATTFLLSYVNLKEMQLPVALLIAMTKGLFVLLIFMHLGHHPKTARLAVALAIGFLLLLMGGALSDVWTRFPVAVPSDAQWPQTR